MPMNEFGQPIGPSLGSWRPPTQVPHREVVGRWATVRPLTDDDAAALHAAFARSDDALWTYLTIGPFDSPADVRIALDGFRTLPDWRMFTIDVDGDAAGFAAYLRVSLRDGTLEIGSIAFSDALQRTTAATEAMSIMIREAFDAGFRRVEWKCDDLNGASRRAAERLGFRFEGVFRKATHYRGRSRDTAWFAITDDEWPAVRRAHDAWLDPSNFDADGRQRSALRPT